MFGLRAPLGEHPTSHLQPHAHLEHEHQLLHLLLLKQGGTARKIYFCYFSLKLRALLQNRTCTGSEPQAQELGSHIISANHLEKLKS